MKRLIALLLAIFSVFGILSFAGAAFTDEKSINAAYQTAVSKMSEKGVISGFEDGSFKPSETLTRAQAAKIICLMLEGVDAAGKLPPAKAGFDDVPDAHWAAKFVAYCAGKNIVSGVGGAKFDPNGKLTSAAFGKMLLTAHGHDAEKEGLVGENWFSNTAKALEADALNNKVDILNRPITRAAACQLSYNFIMFTEDKNIDTSAYKVTEFPLTEVTAYRRLGRTEINGGLVCDYSGSGLEFVIECKGDLIVTEKSTGTHHLRATVDGVLYEPISFSSSSGTQKVVAENLRPGVHTVRMIKDSAINEHAVTLVSVTADAVPGSMKPTADRTLLIEYIGDSITSGAGIMEKEIDGSKTTAALSFGVLTSDLLNADFSLICRGGIGLQKEAGGAKIDEIYAYQNYYRDQNKKYDFARNADYIVVAIGTNDERGSAEFPVLMKEFVTQLRKYNGNSCKIIFLYDMMNDKFADEFPKLAEELPGCYSLRVKQNRQGGTNHPNQAAHESFAKDLSAFIQKLK